MFRSIAKLLYILIVCGVCILAASDLVNNIKWDNLLDKPWEDLALILFLSTIIVLGLGAVGFQIVTVRLVGKIYDVYHAKSYKAQLNNRHFSTEISPFWFVAMIFWILIGISLVAYSMIAYLNQRIGTNDYEILEFVLFCGALTLWGVVDVIATHHYLKRHSFLEQNEINQLGSS